MILWRAQAPARTSRNMQRDMRTIDVYKRQVLRVALLVITDKDLLDLPATMGTIVRLQQFPAVSYTHLDVYKRQV